MEGGVACQPGGVLCSCCTCCCWKVFGQSKSDACGALHELLVLIVLPETACPGRWLLLKGAECNQRNRIAGNHCTWRIIRSTSAFHRGRGVGWSVKNGQKRRIETCAGSGPLGIAPAESPSIKEPDVCCIRGRLLQHFSLKAGNPADSRQTLSTRKLEEAAAVYPQLLDS